MVHNGRIAYGIVEALFQMVVVMLGKGGWKDYNMLYVFKLNSLCGQQPQ